MRQDLRDLEVSVRSRVISVTPPCGDNHGLELVPNLKIKWFAIENEGDTMMMLYRLVHLIETHSQALATCLLDRVKASDATPDYKNVPPEELREVVYEIYRHLGDWLLTKDELDLERRYLRIGAERARQNIPFSQVAWVIVLVKENLWEFLKNEKVEDRPVEVSGELEMLQLLDRFFDRAIFYAAVGYELRKQEPVQVSA